MCLFATFSHFLPIYFRRGGVSSKAITTTDTTSYVSVGELFNSSTKKVNPDNYNILLKYITGDANATIDTVDTKALQITDASEIRAFTLSAGTQGSTSYSAKTNGKDLCVKLGGLDWQVMYLSKDKSGNSILTLWLDNNVQDVWSGRSATEGQYYGFLDGGLYSRYSANWINSGTNNLPYRSSLYGTSYVSAVTLNNGGLYATSYSAASNATKSSSNVFSLFTMEEFGLTDYIVTPRNVSWQESGQSPITYAYQVTSNLSNENWSKATSNDGFSSADYNFASLEYSDAWADSYIWLPSLSETGNYPSTSNVANGIWRTSLYQRQGYNGVHSNTSIGNVGAKSGAAFVHSMMRSSAIAKRDHIYPLTASGGSSAGNGNVRECYGIRPALHINLDAMYINVMEQTAKGAEAGEIYNTSNKTINTNNLKILAKYITGNASATSNTISTKASEITDASEIRNYTISAGTQGGVSYKAKTVGQDVTVTIGGIEWTALYLSQDKSGNNILTLWMNGFKQDAWNSRSGTEGAYYGFSDGVMYSDYSANWSNVTQGNYPSNMYGTSYINAVTLNNGGSYATSNSAVTTATQSSSSVFAPFTMSTYGLTQYLVKPRNVAWQENQSAKEVEHVSFNYPNDAWSRSTSNDGFFNTANGVSNYASKTSSDAWADSYLWLPSATEIGYARNAEGLWKSSQAQRGNYGAIEGRSVGTTSGATYASSWLRSGHFMDDSSFAYSTKPTGTDLLTNIVSDSRVVRPCIHLNLTAMMQAVGIASVSEESSETTLNINKLNTNIDMIPINIGSRGSVKKERIY